MAQAVSSPFRLQVNAPRVGGRLYLAETWKLPTNWTDAQRPATGGIFLGKHVNMVYCPWDGNVWGFGGDGYYPGLGVSTAAPGFFHINTTTQVYSQWYPRYGKVGKEFPWLPDGASWTWDSTRNIFRSENGGFWPDGGGAGVPGFGTNRWPNRWSFRPQSPTTSRTAVRRSPIPVVSSRWGMSTTPEPTAASRSTGIRSLFCSIRP